jgi:hypothetical protein
LVATNPVLEDTYECGSCLIAFERDGTVLDNGGESE